VTCVLFFFSCCSPRTLSAPARHRLGGGGGLAPYAHLVVSDSGTTPHNGVRVTYLGTNGYEFEFKGHALLVDPYFSRVDLLSVALGCPIEPNVSRINDGLRDLAREHVGSSAFRRRGAGHADRVNAELQTSPRMDAILVTHGHFDHLLDVPVIMSKTRARLIASASSVELARRAGASSPKAFGVNPGDVRRIGGAHAAGVLVSAASPKRSFV
jgi:L-ascorbate metabolism protein UlaG (beta-lactamase superfamily)